ncbi:benzoate 4-monooxygenase cytochrome P450, putative [Paecilomyces variotii No. 5]|uniref:Benzoate 4-monooxygenase cytochrome P450, putative n=1 Tax=Byssochlamys spectabilis (strain No. 5 / NBRC 109023) TaxID=1356009 RepID=V5FQM9_BYSSN|nr:benzoate 4-monooxygenase cytochrome P450, putative [Paecilomyces variotii No. 5]
MSLAIVALTTICVASCLYYIFWTLFLGPLARIPGPKSFAITSWKLAKEDYKGTRTRKLHHLHQKYGPAVRVGPDEISFNSVTALRQIYGAGSPFGRPASFYRVFDIYGQAHMFTYHSTLEHSSRKKIMSQLYAKSTVLKGPVADSIETKVKKFLNLIESDPRTASHLTQSLHYFSLDNITWMVFRDRGSTNALSGNTSDKQILSDIEQPTARRYVWFQIHLPRYTRLIMSCSSHLSSIFDAFNLLPGRKPLAYSGLQDYALATFNNYRFHKSVISTNDDGLMSRLIHEQDPNYGKGSLSDMEIAAECADHLDAGLKTTSDTLMFALWVLSRPEHIKYQERLVTEIKSATDLSRTGANMGPVLPAEICDRLPFLDAVVKETLRLYAPIPASQPRTSTRDVVVDGFHIPAGTIVSCQAFSLHRNPQVFPDPYTFNPDRWLAVDADVAEMKRWWWPFSSGGRMCLGMQLVFIVPSRYYGKSNLRIVSVNSLALAEIKTLLASIYSSYRTTLAQEFKGLSPTATSRFELVYDDSFAIDEASSIYRSHA